MKVIKFDEPIVAVTQPYESSFSHEVIEVYSLLTALRPLLRARPATKVVLRCRLAHLKMLPLLHAYGVDPKRLHIIVLDDADTIFQAPYIITVLQARTQGHTAGWLPCPAS